MIAATAAIGTGLYRYYADIFAAGQVAQTTAPAADGQLAESDNSIAVMPFADLSEDGDQAHLSDGIAEEILNLLAQVDGLKVAARTSSFAFRGENKDIKEIGRRLNVSKVLEGSIRKYGNQLRLTAQLIDVNTGFHVWSKNYEREAADIFAIQDDVAQSIAAALLETFTGLEDRRSPFAVTSNLDAYEAYRTGRMHWWRRSPAELQKAIELFANAIKHDPNFAPAYSGLADSWLLLSSYGNLSQAEGLRKATPAIERAFALNPQSAEAFASLGLARWQIGQNDSAESSLRQAIKLDDSYIPAQLWLAGLLADQGRLPEEKLTLEAALERDPLNELLNINYASNCMMRGDFAAGNDVLSSILEVKPNSTSVLRTLANWSGNYGRLAEAQRSAQHAVDLEPGEPMVLLSLAKAWMDLGSFEAAEEIYLQARSIAGDNEAVNSSWFFFLLAAGRIDEMRRELSGVELLDANNPQQKQAFRNDQYRRGLVELLSANNTEALGYLQRAKAAYDDFLPDGDTLTLLSMLAAVQQRLDLNEAAIENLELMERLLARARSSGFNVPEMLYIEAATAALRGDVDHGLEKLERAYDAGFRRLWLVQIDLRLDALRDNSRFTSLIEKFEQALDSERQLTSQPLLTYNP
jgi:TolB-like protein/Flp pilus assembly protein TadD